MNPLDTSKELLNRARSLGVTGSGVNALSAVVTPAAITSETLGSTEQPININDPKPSTTAAGISGRSTALLELDALEKEQEAKIAEQQAKLQENESGQEDILEEIGLKKKELTTQGQQEFGTDVLKDVRKEALGKLKTAQVQELAEIKALSEQPGTLEQKAQRTSDIRQKYGMDQLQYQLEYSIANSDLVAAEQIINDRITLSIEPLLAKLDLKQNVYNQISDSLNKAESREWELSIQNSQREIENVKELERARGDVVMLAAKNGTPLPSYVVAELNRANSLEELNMVLARNGVNLAEPVTASGGANGLGGGTLEDQIANLKLTAAQKGDLVDIQTLGEQIATVESLASDGALAGIGGLGVGSAKQTLFKLFGTGSDEGAQVRTTIGNIKGQIAKLRGGTSFTANEEKLLDSYVPGINESTASVLAKLAGLKSFLKSKQDAIIRVGGGTIAPSNTNDPLGIGI